MARRQHRVVMGAGGLALVPGEDTDPSCWLVQHLGKRLRCRSLAGRLQCRPVTEVRRGYAGARSKLWLATEASGATARPLSLGERLRCRRFWLEAASGAIVRPLLLAERLRCKSLAERSWRESVTEERGGCRGTRWRLWLATGALGATARLLLQDPSTFVWVRRVGVRVFCQSIRRIVVPTISGMRVLCSTGHSARGFVPGWWYSQCPRATRRAPTISPMLVLTSCVSVTAASRVLTSTAVSAIFAPNINTNVVTVWFNAVNRFPAISQLLRVLAPDSPVDVARGRGWP